MSSGTVVPTPLFFVRNNYPPATLSVAEWSLRVDGRVREPLTVRLSDLQALPVRSHEMWMECAGNGRSHFRPPAEGNQWNDFAVSNAVFTGVPLSSVLEQAGIEADAVEVVATGGDTPEFQRGLPLAVALQPDVLLAWEMNGEPIPSPNGGPVRLVVPKWAGIASVKWPIRLKVVDQPFAGYYNAQRYIFVDASGSTLRTVRELPVKSIIAWPGEGERLGRTAQTLFGFAWSGYSSIARVDVSTDNCVTWAEARLEHGDGPLAWTRWELDWTPASPGKGVVASRATDSAGNVQPPQPTWNKFGYEMNAIAHREVLVGD